MNDSGFELMRHALGVEVHRFGNRTRYTKPWRNHFVAGGLARCSCADRRC